MAIDLWGVRWDESTELCEHTYWSTLEESDCLMLVGTEDGNAGYPWVSIGWRMRRHNSLYNIIGLLYYSCLSMQNDYLSSDREFGNQVYPTNPYPIRIYALVKHQSPRPAIP